MFVSSQSNGVFKNELYTWIQTYSPTSEWAKANAKDKELISRANQLIETTAQELYFAVSTKPRKTRRC